MQEQLIEIFKEEAEDLLITWESIVLGISESDKEKEINELFRTAHTLKGSSKAVGFKEFGTFVHKVVDLMRMLQNNINLINEVSIQILLDAQAVMITWLDSDQEPEHSIDVIHRSNSFLTEENQTPEAQKPNTSIVHEKTKSTKSDPSIKVKKSRIDSIIQYVGEINSQLSILEQEFLNRNNLSNNEVNAINYLRKYLTSLEDDTFSLSLQPVGGLFQRLERVCHDVAKVGSKELVIIKKGSETEIDKTVLEKILDPLMHLVRNAVDHGIEDPNHRRSSGKDSKGQIIFEARQESGYVSICIKDDGKGLNRAAILKKAIEKGFIDESDELTDNELNSLILKPGFSTKEAVTEVSGRGVGMDVVNSAINDLGGTLSIDSLEGKGTSFLISLPTNISLMDSIVIRDNEQIYAVPISDCEEIIDLNQFPSKMQDEHNSIVWNKNIVYIKNLSDFFPLHQNNDQNEKNDEIAIISKSNGLLGVSFGSIVGKYKIFVKPLKGNFENMYGVSGTTILPNGDASLVINIREISNYFHNEFKEVSNG